MRILLTGATGTIGSVILPALLRRGHEVVAPVRSAEKAAVVDAAGGTGVVADLADPRALVELLRSSDAAIHTASSPDDPEGFDRGVASAVIEAFGGTGRPYVHTGGCWIYGSGDGITEQDAYDPPALTVWRPRVLALLEDADVALSVVHPGIVHGGRASIAALLADPPRTADGRFTTLGSGEQHWTTVHVDDLADLYVRVVEAGPGVGAVLGVSDHSPRVADLSEAAADGAGVATEDPRATRERLGAEFADALLLDQRPSNAKARGLGWTPTRPSLLETMRAERPGG